MMRRVVTTRMMRRGRRYLLRRVRSLMSILMECKLRDRLWECGKVGHEEAGARDEFVRRVSLLRAVV
jgi:hypothetical protein